MFLHVHNFYLTSQQTVLWQTAWCRTSSNAVASTGRNIPNLISW